MSHPTSCPKVLRWTVGGGPQGSLGDRELSGPGLLAGDPGVSFCFRWLVTDGPAQALCHPPALPHHRGLMGVSRGHWKGSSLGPQEGVEVSRTLLPLASPRKPPSSALRWPKVSCFPDHGEPPPPPPASVSPPASEERGGHLGLCSHLWNLGPRAPWGS